MPILPISKAQVLIFASRVGETTPRLTVEMQADFQTGFAWLASLSATSASMIFNSIILKGGGIQGGEVMIIGEEQGLTPSDFIPNTSVK